MAIQGAEQRGANPIRRYGDNNGLDNFVLENRRTFLPGVGAFFTGAVAGVMGLGLGPIALAAAAGLGASYGLVRASEKLYDLFNRYEHNVDNVVTPLVADARQTIVEARVAIQRLNRELERMPGLVNAQAQQLKATVEQVQTTIEKATRLIDAGEEGAPDLATALVQVNQRLSEVQGLTTTAGSMPGLLRVALSGMNQAQASAGEASPQPVAPQFRRMARMSQSGTQASAQQQKAEQDSAPTAPSVPGAG